MAKTPFSQTKFSAIFFSSWLAWECIHAYVLYSLGIKFWLAAVDSGISNSLLCGGIILLSNNMRYYLPKKDRLWYILVFSLFIAAAAWVLAKYILRMFATLDVAYQNLLEHSYTIRYCINFLIIAFMAVICVLWYAFEEKEKETERAHETAKLAKEAELYKLRQQLQPHFLFNSLNSINALIGSKPQEARVMVQQLSGFLRSTLKKEDNQWVPLKEELEQLELYLAIEKSRFGNRLQTQMTADEESLQLKIPVLLLQPLVENAIKFGLYGTVGEAVIELFSTVINGNLVIEVVNPFDKESAPEEKGTGFGLNSVQRRLYLLFGRNDLVGTKISDNKFMVNVTVPQAG